MLVVLVLVVLVLVVLVLVLVLVVLLVVLVLAVLVLVVLVLVVLVLVVLVLVALVLVCLGVGGLGVGGDGVVVCAIDVDGGGGGGGGVGGRVYSLRWPIGKLGGGGRHFGAEILEIDEAEGRAGGVAPVLAPGETLPPQAVLSYHFAPNTEAQVQAMVNHLEAIVVSAAIHKLKALAKPPPPPPPPPLAAAFGPRDTNSASAVKGGVVSAPTSLHDLAALQLAQEGEEDGPPKRPLTVKVTLLNPVVMLPEDERDPDSNALFLQGLIMAHYVRSPRFDKASQAVGGGRGCVGRGATAEARDTSLEIIRLESQLGRMSGVSSRGGGSTDGSAPTPALGGLGIGAGAIDPVTLSLHYSEVEKPLHPMGKDLKCQVEEVVCQLTYQDMALFHTVLSGWSKGILGGGVPEGGVGNIDKPVLGSMSSSSSTLAPTSAAGLALTARETTGLASGLSPGLESGLSPGVASGLSPGVASGLSSGVVSGLAPELASGVTASTAGSPSGLALGTVPRSTSALAPGVASSSAPTVIDLSRGSDELGLMTGAEEATRAAARAAWGASGLELEAGEDGGRGAEEEEGTRRTRRAEDTRFYEVVFETRQLGFVLVKQDGVAIVEEIHTYNGVGGREAGPFAGDELFAVGGEVASRLSYNAVAGSPPLRPRPGAVVVSIDDRPISHLKVSAVRAMLDRLSSKSPLRSRERAGGSSGRNTVGGSSTRMMNSMSPPSEMPSGRGNGYGGGGGAGEQRLQQQQQRRQQQQQQQRVAPRHSENRTRRASGGRRKLRVVLREVEVHAWSPNWRQEVQCPGVRVTVIDDREGRDMPLLRAEVGSLDMTHESGPGMASAKGKGHGAAANRREAADSPAKTVPSYADLPVPISRIAAACEAQVDYYNATAGRWEPLLERVVAKGDREVVTRRAIADGEGEGGGGGREGRTSSIARLSCFEEDVKVNVTHAALDVILRALRDYREITAAATTTTTTIVSGSGSSGTGSVGTSVNGGKGDRTGEGVLVSVSAPDARDNTTNGGVEAAAGAQQQQRYSPFILQNRTGLTLEFWAHQDKVDSVSRFVKRGTVVDGMSDQPFSTSVEARRNRRHASWMLSLLLVPDGSSSSSSSSATGGAVAAVGGCQDAANLAVAAENDGKDTPNVAGVKR
eukprot:jgi/Undpi1/4284/HiC_scaffold_17.g07650.m1